MGFIFKLGMFGFDGFKFDGNFFIGDDVGFQVDIVERFRINFLVNVVFVIDVEILFNQLVCFFVIVLLSLVYGICFLSILKISVVICYMQRFIKILNRSCDYGVLCVLQ